MTDRDPTVWQRGPARLVGETLTFTAAPTAYDPFAPGVPLPEAAALSHGLAPWREGPLLVDALAQVAQEGTAAVEVFAAEWGLLTTEGDAEPLADFRGAAAAFHLLCELLASSDAPPVTPPAARLAPHLARVFPVPLAAEGVKGCGGEGVTDKGRPAGITPSPLHPFTPSAPLALRWGFATLEDAAYWQLACFLAAGHTMAVCEWWRCDRLFLAWNRKRHCSERCAGARRVAALRARRREKEETL